MFVLLLVNLSRIIQLTSRSQLVFLILFPELILLTQNYRPLHPHQIHFCLPDNNLLYMLNPKKKSCVSQEKNGKKEREEGSLEPFTY